MKKRLICLSLIFAMTVTQIVPVAAARKDEVQAQKSATQSKLSDAQARVDELQSQKSALMNQISSTQQELVSVMTQVNMLNESIQEKETDIQATQKKLEEAQAERDKQYEDMKKRIQYLYENGNTSWAQALLESNSIADMLSKMETSQKVYDYDREALQKLKDAVQAVQDLEEQLETEKAELESSKQEQEGIQQSLEDQISSLKSSASDYDVQIASAQAQAQQYQQLIEEQNAELQQIQEEEEAAAKAAAEAAKAQNSTDQASESSEEQNTQTAEETEDSNSDAVTVDTSEEKKEEDSSSNTEETVEDDGAADTENGSQENETVEEDREEEASQPAETPSQPAETPSQPVETPSQPEETPSVPAGGNNAAQEDQSQDNTAAEEPADDVSYNSSIGEAIVAYAKQFIGNPYVYGGNSLTNGIDCSGFTQQIYAHFGYSLPRTSYAQAYVGKEVSWSESKAGDLIVYPGHVAILTGDGGIVHASNSAPYPKGGIKYTSNALYTSYVTIRRIAE